LGFQSGLKWAKGLIQSPSAKGIEAAKIKEKPATRDGRTAHRTLSTKRTLLQILVNSHICERCLEKEEESDTYPT
jgi:hypothetical protein